MTKPLAKDPKRLARIVIASPPVQDEIFRILAFTDRETLLAVRARLDSFIAHADAVIESGKSESFGKQFICDYTPQEAARLVTKDDIRRGDAMVANHLDSKNQARLVQRESARGKGV